MYEEHIPGAIPSDIKGLLLQALGERELALIHNNFYASSSEHDFFQGNCMDGFPFINLPDPKIATHTAIIVSNPCDTDLRNEHRLSPRITYCAIKKLASFEGVLKKYSGMTDAEIKAYIANVKAQRVSDIFYLPSGRSITDERVALFGQAISADMTKIADQPHNVSSRLAQKAYYLFLTKLSIHFLRFGDLSSQSA